MEALNETTQIQKYPAYKDSGVDWLGEIPTHWKVEKGKWLFEKQDRPVRSEDGVVTAFRDGQVTLRSNRREDGFTNAIQEHGYQGIRKGDLVIHAMDAFAGAIGVSESDGKSSPVYAACIPRSGAEANPYFFAYFLRHLAKTGFIESLAKGIRERSTDFRFKDFGLLELSTPPLVEQTRIAEFLDRKTAQIDQAIAQKERLIELLNERRQVLIHRAVTRGLNPDAPLKDSGIEWIGEIPAHWEVKPLKFMALLQSGNTIGPDQFIEEGFPVYGGNGFRGYTGSFTNDGQHALIGRQGALCGNINYAEGKFYASEHAIVVYTFAGNSFYYLGEIMRVANFNRLSQTAAQPGIAVNIVKNQYLPNPPSIEQHEITKYIKAVEGQIKKSISLQRRQIQKLQELKATLINSAVTGKIRV